MVCYNVLRPQDKGGTKDGKQIVPTEIDEESDANNDEMDEETKVYLNKRYEEER
jgi:hypothetical protein